MKLEIEWAGERFVCRIVGRGVGLVRGKDAQLECDECYVCQHMEEDSFRFTAPDPALTIISFRRHFTFTFFGQPAAAEAETEQFSLGVKYSSGFHFLLHKDESSGEGRPGGGGLLSYGGRKACHIIIVMASSECTE